MEESTTIPCPETSTAASAPSGSETLDPYGAAAPEGLAVTSCKKTKAKHIAPMAFCPSHAWPVWPLFRMRRIGSMHAGQSKTLASQLTLKLH